MLLSGHLLSEVEALCDRVTIIRGGRTVEAGTLAELRHLTRTAIDADLATAPDGLAGLPGVHDVSVRGTHVPGTHVHFTVDAAALESALRQLAGAGVRSLISRPPTLEELFLRHYQQDDPAAVPR